MSAQKIWKVNKVSRQNGWRESQDPGCGADSIPKGHLQQGSNSHALQPNHIIGIVHWGTTLQQPHAFLLSTASASCTTIQMCSCWQRVKTKQLTLQKPGKDSPRAAWQWEDTGKPVCPLLTWPTFLHLGWPGWPLCSYCKVDLGSISFFFIGSFFPTPPSMQQFVFK